MRLLSTEATRESMRGEWRRGREVGEGARANEGKWRDKKERGKGERKKNGGRVGCGRVT